MNKQISYIHTKEYYSVMKIGKICQCYKMGESWRCYTVVWNKQVTDKYCGIPLTQGTWSSQNREDRKYNGDFQGEGGKG